MKKLLALLLLSSIYAKSAELQTPGQAFEWGQTYAGRSAALAALTNCVLISGNSAWTVALKEDRTAIAWGRNTEGETNVPSGYYKHIFAAWRHGVGVFTNGTVTEWGTPYGVPIEEWELLRPNITTAVMAVGGDDHSAALLGDGTVLVWGGRNSVTNKPSLLPCNSIASGWWHMLALQNNGTVVAWGEGNAVTEPVPSGCTNIVAIEAGPFLNMALRADGQVFAWGQNTYGEANVPAEAHGAVILAPGRFSAKVLHANGTIVSWGDSSRGQLPIPSGLTNATFLCGGFYAQQAIQAEGGIITPPTTSTYYVATNGNNANAGTVDAPFKDIQYGVNVATNGQTVLVSPGLYNEYVSTVRSGSSANRITVSGNGEGEVILRGFRFNNHQYITISDLIFQTTATNTWVSHVRVEPSAHNNIVLNCTMRNTPVLIRSNWNFDHTTRTISSPTGSDWASAGFVVNSKIFAGSSSMEPHWYANQGRGFTITNISGSTAYVSEVLNTETNSSAWAPIYSGVNFEGIDGIKMIESGGGANYATNLYLAGNTFSNIYGSPFVLVGYGPVTVTNNRSFNTYSRASIHPNAGNITVVSNYWINSTNWIHYSVADGSSVSHGAGPAFYDYVQGHIHSGSPKQNVVFRGNWWENIQQPLGQISEIAGATNWLFQGNVWVGLQEHMGNGVNGTYFDNNTFYKVSYDEDRTHALSVGGNSAQTPVTNMWIRRNAFIDVGSHKFTAIEGFYGLVNAVNSGASSNYTAGPESTAWRSHTTFNEIDGVNGGDPVLRDPWNPRGADGLPFTADDGLRPLPNSPLALLSIGALSPMSITANYPVAHFSAIPASPQWFDPIGTNFNPSWAALAPFNRTNKVRPYGTTEAIGKVPAEVTFNAANSISSTWSTNSWHGIREFHWDFGDGSTIISCQPTQRHVYLWPGTFTVNLTVINSATNSNSLSRVYRVLAQDQYSGTVYHVKTNGNNSNPGTYDLPFLTINKATTNVIAGDYVAVHPGDYQETVELYRNVANPSSRITFAGYNARIKGFNVKHPYYTVRQFTITNFGAILYNGVVQIAQVADDTHILDNLIINTPAARQGIYVTAAGDPAPDNGTLNGRIIGNTFTNVGAENVLLSNGSNWLFSANRHIYSYGEGDGYKIHGRDITIQDSYIYNLNKGQSGGHPDFFQIATSFSDGAYQPLTFWVKDVIIQRNWVEGDPNDVLSFALGQMATIRFGEDNWTNIVFRNNIFKNVRGTMSDSVDGLKFYNNTFWRSPSETGQHATAGGGVNGSSYGTTFTNNAFVELGGGAAENSGWYYNATGGSQASNTTVFADFNYVGGLNGAAKQVAPPDETGRWAVTGTEASGVNGGDPAFAIAGLDFRLLTNSVLINAGANLSSMFTDDFFGNTRPASGAWHIGAIQATVGEAPAGPETDAPEPDPMTFDSVPAAVDYQSITMTATTATDAQSPPVMYFFEEVTAQGHNSGWQSSPAYTDINLNPDTQYGYRVKARDAIGNETDWSTSAFATTDALPAGVIFNIGELNLGEAQ